MSRRAVLNRAAQWAFADDEAPAPVAAADVVATLEDPALTEALSQSTAFGRLSDGDVRALRASRRRKLAAGGSVAALLLVVGAGIGAGDWLRQSPVAIRHYETQRGEQVDVALADGTRLHLDGATSLDVTLGKEQRTVAMKRGQAYFDVAHQADRPFVVQAGRANTQVLGTAFDVELGRGDVKLAVYRGAVRFSGDHDAVIVRAGWRSRFADGSTSLPIRFDASQQNWRQGWLDTDATRLGDLVDALNRRGGPVIEAPSGALANIMLAGRFRLDNAQQLLEGIGPAYGFDAVRNGGHIRLIARGGDVAKSSSE